MKRVFVIIFLVLISFSNVSSQSTKESIRCGSDCQRQYQTETRRCRVEYKNDQVSKIECLKIAKLELEHCKEKCQ